MNRIYKAYVQPHFDYAITVWGGASKKNIKPIQKLQNFAARCVSHNFDFKNTRGENLIKQLKWCNLRERYEFLLSKLMFKCVNKQGPLRLINEVHKTYEINAHRNRSTETNDLYEPFYRNTCMDMSLKSAGPKTWNKLPTQIKNSKTSYQFTTMYKKLLLNM